MLKRLSLLLFLTVSASEKPSIFTFDELPTDTEIIPANGGFEYGDEDFKEDPNIRTLLGSQKHLNPIFKRRAERRAQELATLLENTSLGKKTGGVIKRPKPVKPVTISQKKREEMLRGSLASLREPVTRSFSLLGEDTDIEAVEVPITEKPWEEEELMIMGGFVPVKIEKIE